MKLLNWSTYELLKRLYDHEEIMRILNGGIGDWIVIPSGEQVPYAGTAYEGERAIKRAKNFFLN